MSILIPNTLQYPNFYVDELMHLLSPEENVVLMFATRQILGWDESRGTRRARISVSVFCDGYEVRGKKVANGTGLSRGTIIDCLETLCQHGILLRVGESKKHDPRGQEYEINFDPFQIDIAGLRKRLLQTDELNSKRIVQATQALSDKKITSSSDDTTTGLSDDISGSLSDRHIETKKERNIYTEKQEEFVRPTNGNDDLFAGVQAPLPPSPRTKEQIKEGVRNAIADYAKSGGKKRGVADPHLAQTDRVATIAKSLIALMGYESSSIYKEANTLAGKEYGEEWITRQIEILSKTNEFSKPESSVFWVHGKLEDAWAKQTAQEEKIWDFSN